jgi:hypothetical protein
MRKGGAITDEQWNKIMELQHHMNNEEFNAKIQHEAADTISPRMERELRSAIPNIEVSNIGARLLAMVRSK